VALYPAVIDFNNWFKVNSAFTFDSSAQDLRSRLGL